MKYPDMVVKESECDDGNAIHCWNRFKEDVLGKDNYHRNHESRDLFEETFDILMA